MNNSLENWKCHIKCFYVKGQRFINGHLFYGTADQFINALEQNGYFDAPGGCNSQDWISEWEIKKNNPEYYPIWNMSTSACQLPNKIPFTKGNK